MPLARIITTSQACSRELALDLLFRGYTVEIVSPDKVPDSLADLELRVDAGPGDQLVASVEAHGGKRSASLDFVHHLKSPMADFVRRPIPLAGNVPPVKKYTPEQKIADLSVAEVDRPAMQSVAPLPDKITPVATRSSPDPEPKPKESARVLAAPEQLPTVPIQPLTPVHVASTSTQLAVTTRPKDRDQNKELAPKRDRTAGGFWSAAFTFGCIVLLTFVLWIGIRQAGKATHVSRTSEAQKVVVSPTAANSMSNRDAAQNRQNRKESVTTNAGAARAGTSATVPGDKVSPRHAEDFVARDTVIYLDKRVADAAATRANPTKHFAARRPNSSETRGGVIAANSVTYLTAKPTAKAEKQDLPVTSGSQPK